ncbi:MAG TPA: SRPBCC family protein [bacterium]
MTRSFLTIALVAALLAFLSSKGWAEDVVFFNFLEEDNVYSFNGCFFVEADPLVAWDVLTDYNHLSQFVSNMSGHLKRRTGNDLLLEQTVGGGFLFIREEVKAFLEVHEEPFHDLFFKDVSRKHFDFYQGHWSVQPYKDGGLKVEYALEAKRNLSTPGFVKGELFKTSTRDLMVQMRKEMLRRQ